MTFWWVYDSQLRSFDCLIERIESLRLGKSISDYSPHTNYLISSQAFPFEIKIEKAKCHFKGYKDTVVEEDNWGTHTTQ